MTAAKGKYPVSQFMRTHIPMFFDRFSLETVQRVNDGFYRKLGPPRAHRIQA